MKIIGLTGGIASGKSTVSETLAQLGAIIIDGDKIGHQAMEPGQPAYEQVVKHFGSGILNEDKTIDRTKLGAIVFFNPEQMKALNRNTWPWIFQSVRDQIEMKRLSHPNAVLVLDIPLLFEGGWDKLCDVVWVIWVDRETQITRLMARNSLTREEAIKRIDSQMSLDEKAQRADVVIDNTGSIEQTLSLATRYYLDILHSTPI